MAYCRVYPTNVCDEQYFSTRAASSCPYCVLRYHILSLYCAIHAGVLSGTITLQHQERNIPDKNKCTHRRYKFNNLCLVCLGGLFTIYGNIRIYQFSSIVLNAVKWSSHQSHTAAFGAEKKCHLALRSYVTSITIICNRFHVNTA